MDDETQQVHQQRLNEAVQEFQEHLLESVSNQLMGRFPADTPVRISVDESSPPDPHMDYRARMQQLEYEYRQARESGDRHHLERCAREMERITHAMREFDERGRHEMSQVERMREDLRRLRNRRPPFGPQGQQRMRDAIRQLENDIRVAEVRERSRAPEPRRERDNPWGSFDFGDLERRYLVSQSGARNARSVHQEINRVSEQIRIDPGYIFDPDRYSTMTGRFSASTPNESTRRGSDRHPGEPTDFVVHGIDVEGRDNTPPDRIFFWGVRTGSSPWVLMIQGESIDTAFFRGLREYETAHGRRPFRARMNSENQRQFGRTPMRDLDPEPQTNDIRTEQMQGPYKIHLTTRQGFKKTISQDSPVTGSFINVPVQMSRAAMVGDDSPVSATIASARYEFTKKAVFTDLQTGAMTEQFWAVERG